ncbi:MAG: glycosyltransferase family 2 protein [Bacillota bacterium]|nr:glycosyltransferase family 2 protein [Bacillota bacterium]
MREEILISVVVPIYRGEKYIEAIESMVVQNASLFETNPGIELIFVNDYPSNPLPIEEKWDRGVKIRVVENERNVGIHQSRIHGLTHAQGEYILFLDQDDRISNDCLFSQLSAIGQADMVVANGYKEKDGEMKKIYRSTKKQALVLDPTIYQKAANQIVSPGQCLIRKSAIPAEWKERVIVQNGGDDLFLWFLMFTNQAKIVLNENCVYTHVETGSNTSNDLQQMILSAENVISILKDCPRVPLNMWKAYQKRISFLKEKESRKGMARLFVHFRYLDICVYKLYAYYR